MNIACVCVSVCVCVCLCVCVFFFRYVTSFVTLDLNYHAFTDEYNQIDLGSLDIDKLVNLIP